MAKKHDFVWSHSSLDEYETCPFKFFRKRIAKDTPDPPGPEAQIGTDIHAALEHRVRDGTPVPNSMPTYAKLGDAVAALPGEKFCELKMGVTVYLTGTGFFSDDVWGRVVADVLILPPDSTTGVVIDYKTGKYRPDNGQAGRNAIGVFANYPHIERVQTAFIYPQENKISLGNFYRSQLQEIMHPTYQTLGRITWSFEHNNWPKRPSGLCKRYCPVATCEHNGKYRR